MRFFLAGIMQGSLRELRLHDQDYRQHLAALIVTHFPEAHVYDPLVEHNESVSYDDEFGREVFFRHNRMCREAVDVLLAFVPEASMGTAIEMWEAYQNGRAVFAISPLTHNWAIKFCSHGVFPNLDAFTEAVVSGELRRRIGEVLSP
jgi:hypothetical protein